MSATSATLNDQVGLLDTLNTEQLTAYQAVMAFLSGHLDQETPFNAVRVTGAAGTGKSYLTARIVETLKSAGHQRLYASAPTHKALHVLEGLVTGSRVQAGTLHSLLGLRKAVDYSTGEESFKASRAGSKLPPRFILLVDEASMINAELLSLLLDSASNLDGLVVFIGDAYQLPPVSRRGDPMATPPAFAHAGIPEYSLTTIQRQAAGNPLIMAAHQYRRVLQGETLDPAYLQPANHNGVGFEVVDRGRMREIVNDLYEEADMTGDTDHVRSLAYTNEAVKQVNRFVRMKTFGKPARPPFEIGERATVNTTVTVYDRETQQEEVAIGTDALVTVTGVRPHAHALDPNGFSDEELPGWVLTLEAPQADGPVDVFLPENPQKVDSHLKQMAKVARAADAKSRSAAWKAYFEFKGKIHDVRPPYAMTVHKSQGSTYRYVLINVTDIVSKASRGGRGLVARLLYVALTRASVGAYLNAPLPLLGAQRGGQ